MIRYTIEKSKNDNYYVLYKNIQKRFGLCSGAIFKGKKKDCENEKRKLKRG